MPVAKEDLQVGRCFATSTDQFRRITALPEGRITYESWSGKIGYQGGTLTRTTVGVEGFLSAVDRKVDCPNYLPPLPAVS